MDEASVKQLKQDRREAKNQMKTATKRRDQVQKALNESLKFTDEYSAAKKQTDNCADQLSSGVSGIRSIASKAAQIRGKGETADLQSQPNFNSNAIDTMQAEINRLNTKIGRLNTKVTACENEIKEQGGIIFPWD